MYYCAMADGKADAGRGMLYNSEKLAGHVMQFNKMVGMVGKGGMKTKT